MSWIEIIGYCGSLLVGVSLTMSNIWKLRWINLFGASTFATYGYLVGSYPVLALNAFITVTDIYYLIKMSRQTDYFNIAVIPGGTSLFMEKFLVHFSDDIQRFFPDFNHKAISDPQCWFILRNLLPVGLFIFQHTGDNTARIHLDYVRPEYRDFKNARFFYRTQQEYLRTEGIDRFIIESSVEAHRRYLRRAGFREVAGQANIFEKTIART